MQLELIDFNIGVGFKAGLRVAKNIKKLLIIPCYQVPMTTELFCAATLTIFRL